MNKIKNFFSYFPLLFLFLFPFVLGLIFPKVVLITLGALYLAGFFKRTGSGWAGVGDLLFRFLGILGAVGGTIGLLFSLFAQ